jgi:hypothetical protein
MSPETIVALLEKEGILSFENEFIAICNIANQLTNILDARPSVKSGILQYNSIIEKHASKEDGYISDQTWRRKSMALVVSVQNKNTLQVGILRTIERGIDLIHRTMIVEQSPFSFIDFDVLNDVIFNSYLV